MTPPARQRGFSAVEALVSLAVLMLAMAGVSVLLVQNARINKAQQMTAALQSDARNCLSMIVQKLRTTGWNPMGAAIPLIQLDPDLGDNVSEIELYADLDGDSATTGADEQILIRHVGDRIEWRRSAAGTFEILAVGITNDADGNGAPEPMFTPDSTTDPSRILVRITAESRDPDPTSGQPIRYTVSSEVILRNRS